MTNVLEAIINIANNPILEIRSLYSGRNRVNNVGEALETFVKDAFANLITETDEQKRMRKYAEEFSWGGIQNHPPDLIIKNGDAVEVKKTQSANSSLPLNSSYPKSTLLSSDPMLTIDCKNCEEWTEKDLIYCVGHTDDDTLKSLWMVYGNIYAAKHETYQIIKQKITAGIDEIPNVELGVTDELGRVNRVDLLGITNLRIRGMWEIQNPRRVFNYLHTPTKNKFELVCIIPTEKYNSFPKSSIRKIEDLGNKNLTIEDKNVWNPNNPAKSIQVKLIKFIISE